MTKSVIRTQGYAYKDDALQFPGYNMAEALAFIATFIEDTSRLVLNSS